MNPVLRSSDIFQSATFTSCHAATLVETDRGILAAWFGGSREGASDVCVYAATLNGDRWSAPRLVADGGGYPCWNPVLFRPRDGAVMLFYKVGPNPRDWWGMCKTSDDNGERWSDPMRLPEGLLGPIKNKPVQLGSGRIISPSSREGSIDKNNDGAPLDDSVTPRTQGPSGWHAHFEMSDDGGRTWRATPPVPSDPAIAAIQPSILIHSPQVLQAIGRTRSSWRLFETWSYDAGETWSTIELTSLPNCNSGTDAVTTTDGWHLLIYNHSNLEKVRYPLNLAMSRDGKAWLAGVEIESEPPGQYSYPAIIQTSDGLVHVAFTWKRKRIRHAVIDVSRIDPRPIDAFVCPPPGSATHRVDPSQ